MKFENPAGLSEEDFAETKKELANVKTLGDVLSWAGTKPPDAFLPQIVAEVITQDEYTHDVVIPFGDLYLVFDTT